MKYDYDVVVVGGGVAGVSSALSAAREGLKVCLIEKGSMLGGLATSGLINWFEPLCDGKGNQLIFSQAEEFFKLATKYGYSTFDENFKENGKRKSSWFNHNLFALSLNKLLIDNGVKIEYETLANWALGVLNTQDVIYTHNVEGMHEISAKVFIDASGNALLFRKEPLKVVSGVNYLTYATTSFKDGVDKPKMQYSGASLDGTNHPEGMRLLNGLKQNDVNDLLIYGQNLALKEYEEGKLKDISNLPSMPQFRKIARICGDFVLKGTDKCKFNKDSIGCIGVFNKPGEWYEIPLQSLYNHKVKNVFACGRIISCDDEAWEATRVIPVAILTGEVCGIMASCYINKTFNIETIQNKLKERKILLHYEDLNIK